VDLRAKLTHRSRTARREVRDRILGSDRDPKTFREDVALAYLRGSGIEIGALNFRLRVPRGVTVRYVDYLPADTLRDHHAHLIAAGQQLTFPDVVDDGERLERFADGELDFVIANHFIEHAEDPIATLQTHVRVLRPGGIIYMAVPDKRRSFDVGRPVTTLEHLVTDHVEGPQTSRAAHYEEWARLVDRVPEDRVADHAADLATRRFSIHFHVWTPAAYVEMISYCQGAGLAVELELLQRNEHEFLTVLRKTSRAPPK
jgi:SAM-dependent methyltransferase